MPRQLTAKLRPVTLSIVEFDLNQGEDIFLTYTHGRENGPEIQRTGRGSPFMEHLNPAYPGEITTHPDGLRLRSWLIQEDLKAGDLSEGNKKLADAQKQGAPPEVIRVLQQYVNENPRLSAHDSEFINAYRQAKPQPTYPPSRCCK